MFIGDKIKKDIYNKTKNVSIYNFREHEFKKFQFVQG